ncbi:MAG: molybdopterin-dependent oxidoreductase [Deltaproteobacteria bacterium]|nr:molybdopterin-dependent oxidoreductase [Deltaproteobacteria bacterium]
MKLDRRQFIKVSGLAAGATYAAGAKGDFWGLTRPNTDAPQTEGDRIVPTFCEMCFWKCGVLAHVKDGRVTKIEGNPDHPLSQGRLCPRGAGGTGLLYDPDRLRQPLLRVKKRGEQVFEPVSWSRALDEVAEKLDRVRQKHGPEALALFSHGFGGSFFKTLVKAYGTGNITAPSFAQCRGPRDAAFQLTFGAAVGSPERVDLENARVIALIGSHLGENMHNTQVQELATAIDRRAEIIVVDPRFSTAAGKARHWLPIKPGTDVALLLAWINVILEEERFDHRYVAEHAIGLTQLREHVAGKTPEWAWTQTGVDPDQIRASARLLAGARPAALVHPGRHSTWDGNDTQRGRAIAILNALLGSWGRKGGLFVPTKKKIAPYPGPVPHVAEGAARDMPEGVVYPFADEVLAHGLRDASLPDWKGEPIKAWMVYGTNLLHALPQPARTIEAMQNLDFSVVIDVLPAEVTGWADVILPEATYLERHDDIHTPGWKRGYAALRQPVVPPLHQSRPGWWIARELATRLGLGEYFPWEDARDYLETRLQASGSSLAELERKGVLVDDEAPITFEEGIAPSFPTPSGKIELYSQQLADAGLPPMPEMVAPVKLESEQFHLLFGRAPTHTFGRTTNNRVLGEVMAENVLWINAGRAKELGFSRNEKVTLVNQDGVVSDPIRLRATERIRPDCVYMVHGFGHTNPKLRFARGKGAADSPLITRTRVDPAMGGTGMNVNVVRLQRA